MNIILIQYSLKSIDTKYQFKRIKVPGIAPYWKTCISLVADFQGGLWGFSPPRRKSQAHILTYAFQGYITSRYGF
jgi:hypothetical protein